MFSLNACQKQCWHCTSILAEEYLYTKGDDTIIVYRIEGATSHYYDSLGHSGYSFKMIKIVELPMEFTFCNEGSKYKPYTNCYRVK